MRPDDKVIVVNVNNTFFSSCGKVLIVEGEQVQVKLEGAALPIYLNKTSVLPLILT